jgi:hypothetical protein
LTRDADLNLAALYSVFDLLELTDFRSFLDDNWNWHVGRVFLAVHVKVLYGRFCRNTQVDGDINWFTLF